MKQNNSIKYLEVRVGERMSARVHLFTDISTYTQLVESCGGKK